MAPATASADTAPAVRRPPLCLTARRVKPARGRPLSPITDHLCLLDRLEGAVFLEASQVGDALSLPRSTSGSWRGRAPHAQRAGRRGSALRRSARGRSGAMHRPRSGRRVRCDRRHRRLGLPAGDFAPFAVAQQRVLAGRVGEEVCEGGADLGARRLECENFLTSASVRCDLIVARCPWPCAPQVRHGLGRSADLGAPCLRRRRVPRARARASALPACVRARARVVNPLSFFNFINK